MSSSPDDHPDYPAALKAIETLFGNTSVPMDQTLDALESLKEELCDRISCLREDLKRELMKAVMRDLEE